MILESSSDMDKQMVEPRPDDRLPFKDFVHGEDYSLCVSNGETPSSPQIIRATYFGVLGGDRLFISGSSQKDMVLYSAGRNPRLWGKEDESSYFSAEKRRISFPVAKGKYLKGSRKDALRIVKKMRKGESIEGERWLRALSD